MTKPDEVFDRDEEWLDLAAFASSAAPGAALGLVYGRRRQGKTLLLEYLAEASGGFYFVALDQASKLNLERLSNAYSAFLGLRVPTRFVTWEQALEALLELGEDMPTPVILDEFPYLLEKEPALPSLVQSLLGPRRRARKPGSRPRLILCGSAISVMRGLLAGPAPLRGRAQLEMVLHPFDFRHAATFWGLTGKWRTAVKLHAIVGGTPAYRDFAGGNLPHSDRDFDRWVARNLLNPSSSFFREGQILLSEESQITDDALYWSVLTAISQGRTRRGQIAAAIGKPDSALGHALTVLTGTQLIAKDEDALKQKRAAFRIAEPILRFRQLITEPNQNRLARRRGERVWVDTAGTVSARIYGPHFEHLAREWTEDASQGTTGEQVSRVGASVVDCAECRTTHEVDVVALARHAHSEERVTAIGEAKWRTTPVGMAELDRLEHILALVNRTHKTAERPRLLLFASSGFTADVSKAATASRESIQLIDLARLYTGS